jgi:hypothetical protein
MNNSLPPTKPIRTRSSQSSYSIKKRNTGSGLLFGFLITILILMIVGGGLWLTGGGKLSIDQLIGTAGSTPTVSSKAVYASIVNYSSDPNQFSNQRVYLEGIIAFPVGLIQCRDEAPKQSWCTVNLYRIPEGDQSVDIDVLFSNQGPNSVTSDNNFLTKKGEEIAEGTPVKVAGLVKCNETGGGCHLLIDSIEKLQLKAITTPVQTETLLPPQAAAPATSIPEPTPTMGCVSALSVSLSDVGKILCVKGDVFQASSGDNAFFIRFDGQAGTFFIIAYDWVWQEAKAGACIQVTGQIQKLGSTPVITLRKRDSYTLCK